MSLAELTFETLTHHLTALPKRSRDDTSQMLPRDAMQLRVRLGEVDRHKSRIHVGFRIEYARRYFKVHFDLPIELEHDTWNAVLLGRGQCSQPLSHFQLHGDHSLIDCLV